MSFRPEPWTWIPWQYAGDAGRFTGRWDDPRGTFRTIYAGQQLLGCLLEVLARFRPDPLLAEDLAAVVEDPHDAEQYPSLPPGVVPTDWLMRRQASCATLSGAYCVVAEKESLPTLRAVFLGSALGHGLVDLDAGALRLSAPRALTQQIAAWLYDLHAGPQDLLDGAQFESRHGDGLLLWAVFERGDDGDLSTRITDVQDVLLHPGHPDLTEAFRLHRLRWAEHS